MPAWKDRDSGGFVLDGDERYAATVEQVKGLGTMVNVAIVVNTPNPLERGKAVAEVMVAAGLKAVQP